MRKKSSSATSRREAKDLSVIDEERLSMLLMEENKKAEASAPKKSSLTITPILSVKSNANNSKIPVVRPTAVKGILKAGKGQTDAAVIGSGNRDVFKSERVNTDRSECVRDSENNVPVEKVISTEDDGYDQQSGLANLEKSIMEADLAVRQAMNVKDDYRESNLHYVDIDIGDTPESERNVTHSYLDKESHKANTLEVNVNKGSSSCTASYNAHHLASIQSDETDTHHHHNHHQNLSTTADPPQLLAPHNIMTQSAPPEYFAQFSPAHTPDHKSSIPSPGPYLWTSHTLPLQSPTDSPRHRPSQSGSPISPASGHHQTIVYVPIVTNVCGCCGGNGSGGHGGAGNRMDALRDIVVHSRRSRDDDQMSMTSSIDSEVARYLTDNRSETGSNFDVQESSHNLSLTREVKIQKALLVI